MGNIDAAGINFKLVIRGVLGIILCRSASSAFTEKC